MDFLGQVEHLGARVVRTPSGACVARVAGLDGADIALPADRDWVDGEDAVLAFRSAEVRVHPDTADGCWPGIVASAVYLGERVQYVIDLGHAQIRASAPAADSLSKGTPVQVEVPRRAIRAWPSRRTSTA
jgi:hypothetical protein